MKKRIQTMKRSLTSLKMPLACAILILIVFLCSWAYGWGGKNIDIMDFDADDVNHIDLGGNISGRYYTVTVSEKDDIQAIIDAVNAFRHTGNEVKYILKYGIGVGRGGTALYSFDVYLSNGENYAAYLASNNGGQDPSNTEVSYWVAQPDEQTWFPFADTCRGSMELFYNLLEEYGTLQLQ